MTSSISSCIAANGESLSVSASANSSSYAVAVNNAKIRAVFEFFEDAAQGWRIAAVVDTGLDGFGGNQSSNELTVVSEDVVEAAIHVMAFVERGAHSWWAILPVFDEGIEELAEWLKDGFF